MAPDGGPLIRSPKLDIDTAGRRRPANHLKYLVSRAAEAQPAEQRIRLEMLRRRLRQRRHRLLCALIDSMPCPIKTLDVGGSPFFWETVENAHRCDITILNKKDSIRQANFRSAHFTNFQMVVGDACHMNTIESGSFDLVICNSVIEHVGEWPDMMQAAQEVFRVAKHGWIQIPAYEFPLEPHHMLPFIHWFEKEIQKKILNVIRNKRKNLSLEMVDNINLVTRREMGALFPYADIYAESLMFFPKSYIAKW